MTEHDPTPWYRQFWPWFLILLPGSAVIASLYTMTLALDSRDSLVTRGEGGVDVITERNLAADRRARELGLGATLEIDAASGAITATLEASSFPPSPRSIELLFSHPTLASRDRAIELSAAIPDEHGNPVYAGHLASVPQGRWYLVLRSGDDWRMAGVWSGAGELSLGSLPGDER